MNVNTVFFQTKIQNQGLMNMKHKYQPLVTEIFGGFTQSLLLNHYSLVTTNSIRYIWGYRHGR
jgi:hypothetical protein